MIKMLANRAIVLGIWFILISPTFLISGTGEDSMILILKVVYMLICVPIAVGITLLIRKLVERLKNKKE